MQQRHRHHIHMAAKELLGVHQQGPERKHSDRLGLAGLRFDEQIHIAVGPRIAPRHRAEHLDRTHAMPARQGEELGTMGFDDGMHGGGGRMGLGLILPGARGSGKRWGV